MDSGKRGDTMATESYTFQVMATVTYEVTIVGLEDNEDEGYMVISDEFRKIQDLADDDRAVAVSERIDIGGVRINN
jgi:hypothetical protein